MSQPNPVQEAVDKFDGSPTKLAAALPGKVLRQHIEHWLKVGQVPAKHCPDVEALTGIRCEALNPEVNWGILRGQSPEATPTTQGA